MNKILIENDIVVSAELSSKIKISFLEKSEDFAVNKLVVDILKDSKLEIIYHNESASKLDILIRVSSNVQAKITEIRTGNFMKIRYRYEIDTNSTLFLQKIHHIEGIRELDTIYLNGEHAKIKYLLKTISTKREKYDITVYHHAKYTESFVQSNGVNVEETLDFHVSSVVPPGMSGAYVDQKNRIVNLTDGKCNIHPNLFIDEYDVSANHSAWIGTFKEDELFYLQSRGIRKEMAIRLLVKGFLLSNLDLTNKRKEEIDNIMDQYWR